MEGNKGPVKVFVRKSGLAPGAKSIDLNSLRQILEKAKNKQQAASNLEKTPDGTAADPTGIPSQSASPEKIQTQPDGDSIKVPDSSKRVAGRTTISIKKDPVSWLERVSPVKDTIKKEPVDNVSNSAPLGGEKRALPKTILEEPIDKKPKVARRRHFNDRNVKCEYTCCFCSYKTGGADDYRKHISTHIKNMRCNLCSFSADTIASYNEHIKVAHRMNNTVKRMSYACSMCPFRALRIESLVKHKTITGHKDKHETPCYKCMMCNYEDESVFKLAKHIVRHPRKSAYCKKCSQPSDESEHDPQCPEVIAPRAFEYEETLEPLKPSMVFDCTLCEFRCEELLFLVEHIKAHAKYKFAHVAEAEGHEENGREDMPFCCTMCEYRCVRPSKLTLHMKTHGPEAIFRCKICDFETKDLALFKVHRKLHLDKKLYPCFVCLLKFQSQLELKLHMSSHTSNKPFACHLCDYKCLTKSRIVLHLKTHSKKTQIFFPCPLCANKYSTSADLRNHLKNHNNEGRPYQCDFCVYSCFTSELLRVHVQKHSRNPRFRCQICQTNLLSEVKLKAHIREHMQTEKPIKCEVCSTPFSSKAQLVRHSTIHEGKNRKSIVCSICSADFPNAVARRVHMSEIHSAKNQTEDTSKISETEEGYYSPKNSSSVDKYGYVEEDVYEDSDSDEENVHEGQHQFIGYPEMEAE